MRSERPAFFWHILTALVLSAIFTLLLNRAGPIAMSIALFIVLALLFIYAIGTARALLLTRRPRMRPFGNGWGRGEWSGVREPRRPRPPYWPPRAAAAVPEDSEPQQPTTVPGYSDIPRQG